jgi:hypothetical protein
MAPSATEDSHTSSNVKTATNQNELRDSHSILSGDQVLFTEQSIPNKGQGLIATRNIAPGMLILSEAPLFTTESLTDEATTEKDLAKIIKSLPKQGQRAFLSLHNNFPGQPNPFSNIVRTNAYPLGSNSGVGAIFPVTARINHSCRPNAQQWWNPRLEKETVHAVREIKEGEEITMSYIQGGASSVRQSELRDHFGFQCTCELCSLPSDLLRISDKRLEEAAMLDEAIGNPTTVRTTPEKALRDCGRLLAIFKREGINDTRVARVWWDAFQICAMHSDAARARVFAERCRKARVLCEGEDGPNSVELVGIIDNPEADENFGYTNKWKTTVAGIPDRGDAKAFEMWLWRK